MSTFKNTLVLGFLVMSFAASASLAESPKTGPSDPSCPAISGAATNTTSSAVVNVDEESKAGKGASAKDAD